MNVADTILAPAKVFKAIFTQRKEIDRRDGFSSRYNLAAYSENRARYMAQSILTSVIPWPELPTYAEALDIIKWGGKEYAL
jgi:hypothetical protein